MDKKELQMNQSVSSRASQLQQKAFTQEVSQCNKAGVSNTNKGVHTGNKKGVLNNSPAHQSQKTTAPLSSLRASG